MSARFLLGRIILTLLVAVMLLPPRPTVPVRLEAEDLKDASLHVKEGWVRLTVAGAPYEMGLQQGVLLRPYLRHLLANNLFPPLLDAGVSPQAARRYARLKWRALPEPFRAELQGIAEGADLLLEDVVIWNLRDELLALGGDLSLLLREVDPAGGIVHSLQSKRTLVAGESLDSEIHSQEEASWPTPLPPVWQLSAPSDRQTAGSMLASWGDATIDRRLWMGALLEAPAGGEQFLFVRRYPLDGQPLSGLALPGQIGLRAGVNGSGVVLLAIPFRTTDRAATGLPPSLLLRHVLGQARDRDEATRLLVGANRTGGARMLVADTMASEGQQVQLSARQFRLLEPDTSLALAVGPPLDGPLARTADLLPQDETPQRGRVTAWLNANAGFISREAVQRLLADPRMGGTRSGVAIVLSPAASRLWLAHSAQGQVAPASGWTSIELETGWTE